MDQETKPIEEQDSFEKEDKQRKALAFLLIFLLSAVGVFYYLTSPKEDHSKVNKVQADKSVQAKKTVSTIVEDKLKEAKKPETEPQKPATEEKEIRIIKSEATIHPKNLIKPTDRSSLIKLAMVNSGRVDPFEDSFPKPEEVIFIKGKTPSSIDIVPVRGGTLPAPPGLKLPFGSDIMKNFGDVMGKAFGKLKIPGLSGDLTKLFQPQSNFEIKGFIGNKVIINVDGTDEAIGKNESYHGIKVVKINPRSLTATFKVNNTVITKKITNPASILNRDDIKLIDHK